MHHPSQYLEGRNLLAYMAKKKGVYEEYQQFLVQLRQSFSQWMEEYFPQNISFLHHHPQEEEKYLKQVWEKLNDEIRLFLDGHKTFFCERLGISKNDINAAICHNPAHGVNRLVKKLADALVDEAAKEEEGRKKKEEEKKRREICKKIKGVRRMVRKAKKEKRLKTKLLLLKT